MIDARCLDKVASREETALIDRQRHRTHKLTLFSLRVLFHLMPAYVLVRAQQHLTNCYACNCESFVKLEAIAYLFSLHGSFRC